MRRDHTIDRLWRQSRLSAGTAGNLSFSEERSRSGRGITVPDARPVRIVVRPDESNSVLVFADLIHELMPRSADPG